MVDDGGPAFPVPDTYGPDGNGRKGYSGMSLRDEPAGALNGLISNRGQMYSSASEPASDTNSQTPCSRKVSKIRLATQTEAGQQETGK